MNEISKLKDVNSIFGGVYLPAALTRCRLLSAFGKLLFAHLAQNADSHNTIQLNFLYTVSELGFLDEREMIETLDELESFGMILVQRGNSNSELVVAKLIPDFTEILSEREMKGKRKKRTRHNPIYNLKNSQPSLSADNRQPQEELADKAVRQMRPNLGKAIDESAVNSQSELFPLESCGIESSIVGRKSNRKQPRSRHTLQDCWHFAQYQRQINGAEKILRWFNKSGEQTVFGRISKICGKNTTMNLSGMPCRRCLTGNRLDRLPKN